MRHSGVALIGALGLVVAVPLREAQNQRTVGLSLELVAVEGAASC